LNKCPYCGQVNIENKIFCTWCGKEISEPPQAGEASISELRRPAIERSSEPEMEGSRGIGILIRLTAVVAIFLSFVFLITTYIPTLSMKALIDGNLMASLMIITFMATLALTGFILFNDDWRLNAMNTATKAILTFLLIIFLSTICVFASLEVGYMNSGYTYHEPILIEGNEDFTAANGVIDGNGTASDPYIIEGWNIDCYQDTGIAIYNTNANFVIRNVHVHSGELFNLGMILYEVSNGTVENCRISNNWRGIQLEDTSNILFKHNDFIGNLVSAYDIDSIGSSWDNGYPSGGNYWSDYTGEDQFSGTDQNIPGEDEIGDEPYRINYFDSKDNYPLMKKYTKSAAPPSWLLWGIVAVIAVAVITLVFRSTGPKLR